MILDYLGAPRKSQGSLEEKEEDGGSKRCADESRVREIGRCNTAGFEDGGRDHKQRNIGGF